MYAAKQAEYKEAHQMLDSLTPQQIFVANATNKIRGSLYIKSGDIERDPNLPTRPPSSYIQLFKDMRDFDDEKQFELFGTKLAMFPPTEQAKLIGAAWQKMDDATKRVRFADIRLIIAMQMRLWMRE
jgi:hypothetical protein